MTYSEWKIHSMDRYATILENIIRYLLSDEPEEIKNRKKEWLLAMVKPDMIGKDGEKIDIYYHPEIIIDFDADGKIVSFCTKSEDLYNENVCCA